MLNQRAAGAFVSLMARCAALYFGRQTPRTAQRNQSDDLWRTPSAGREGCLFEEVKRNGAQRGEP